MKQSIFFNKMSVSVIDIFKDSMKLLLQWGNFSMEINTLKIFIDFEIINQNTYLQSGAFGKIYHYYENNQKYVMKSVGCHGKL